MEYKWGIDANGKTFWGGSGSGAAKGASFSSGPIPIGDAIDRNDPIPSKPIAPMGYGERVRIARIWQSHEELIGKDFRIGGWLKKGAMDKNAFAFLEINDGSCFRSIQAVIQKDVKGFAEASKANAGSCVVVKGRLIKSPKPEQPFELAVENVESHYAEVTGGTDGTYPIAGRPAMEVSDQT